MKSAAAEWKKASSARHVSRKPARRTEGDGLKRDDGWVDMQVQFLIDKKSAGANHVVGWTVLKPGARHVNHRQRNCDEFFIVLKGKGMIYTDHGDKPSSEGDVVYSPRGCWHGFNNTSTEDVVAGLGLDGRRFDRGFRLRSASGEQQVTFAPSDLSRTFGTAISTRRPAAKC